MAKIFCVSLFILAHFSALTARAESEDNLSVHVDSRVDDTEGKTTRIIVSDRGITSFVLSSGGEVTAQAWQCPYFSIGTLYRTGLLRLCDNPLDFLPSSTAFREKTGFRPNTTLSGHSRFTLAAHLLPEAPGTQQAPRSVTAYIVEKDKILEQAGCIAALAVAPWLTAEAVMVMQDDPAPGLPDEWLFDEEIVPGGSMYHTAVRLCLTMAQFSVMATGGVSSGEMALPGTFCLLRSSYDFPRLSLSLTAGLLSDKYVAYDYQNPATHASAALQAATRGVDGLSCSALVRYRRERTGHDGVYTDDYLIDGKTTIAIRLLRKKASSLWISAASKISYNDEPDIDYEAGLEGRFSAAHRLKARYSCTEATGDRTDTVTIDYSLCAARFRFSLSTGYAFQTGLWRTVPEMTIVSGVYRVSIRGLFSWECLNPATPPQWSVGVSLAYTL